MEIMILMSDRYNPYTQAVEILNNQDKILDMAKELRGDLCIVANALKKVQEKDGDIDPEFMTNFLTAGRAALTSLYPARLPRSGPHPAHLSLHHSHGESSAAPGLG